MPPLRPNFTGAGQAADPLAGLVNTLGSFSQRLAQREERDRLIAQQEDDRARQEAQRQATNQGIAAILNPQGFAGQQIAQEQQGTAQSLANLNPADRAVAEQQLAQNYNPANRQDQIVSEVLANPNADQGAILQALGRQSTVNRNNLAIAQATPGTPQFVAKQNADLEQARQRAEITAGNIRLRDTLKRAETQREADSLASILRTNGVRVPQGANSTIVNTLYDNFKETKRRQVREQEKINDQRRKESKEQRDRDKITLIQNTPQAITTFREQVATNVPTETRVFGRNDSGLLNSFFAEPAVIEAIRSNKLTSKQISDRINNNLKVSGDLETALESIAEQLTDGSVNDIGSGIL